MGGFIYKLNIFNSFNFFKITLNDFIILVNIYNFEYCQNMENILLYKTLSNLLD